MARIRNGSALSAFRLPTILICEWKPLMVCIRHQMSHLYLTEASWVWVRAN
jgi:hypothetical protein